MGNPARWKWKDLILRMPHHLIGLVSLVFIISQIGPVSGSTYDEDQWTNWSDWSPCSRTCDGGITQQFRRCKSPQGCHGVSIRRKMCNMQPCSEYKDYRNEQCKAFNGKEYRGKRYTWEAIEDPDNPCALICRAEGTDLVAKLSPKLRDGTRCRSGSLHVCVDGSCQPVGCDLKLGSPKKVDECGICGGDGSKCNSPIYNWESLPTGPCSLNCGGGQQPIKVVCRNSLTSEVVDHFLCNSASKPYRASQSCNIHPCEPEWQAGEWSLCSVTCGGGLRIRKVFCAQEKNGTKIQVADKLCAHIRKPANQEPCNMDICPYWHAGPWSSCSVSCGKGYKTRNVVCRDAMNLPSSACDPELKPADTKACTDQPVCPSLMIATTTSTTTSTTTLAPTALVISRTGPTKKRRVKTTPTEPEPPSSSTMAELGPSKSYMESYSSSHFPDSYPTDYDSEAYFEEDIYPREHTLPLIQPYPPMDNAISFDQNAIPSEPTFVAEEWGPCSQTCGEGVRKREVKCKIFLEFSRTIANLPDKECPGPKPSETESCFARACSGSQEKDIEAFEKLSDSQQALQAEPDPSSLTSNYRNKGIAVGMAPGISVHDMTFSWKVVGYSPCSASCLGGIQEAMIQCVRDYDQRIATPVLCMDKAQPDIATTRTCNDHPCPPRWNVSDFGSCSKPCGGGVMTREVNCIHEVTRGNTVIVPNTICPQPAPKTERLCNAVHCAPYWEPGDWSRCSKPCGGGERTRPLYCKQVTALGQIIDVPNGERHCPHSKPIDTRPCNQKPCSRKGTKLSSSPNDSMASATSSSTGRSHAYMQTEWKKRLSLTVRGHATVYNGILLKLRCPSGKGVDRTRLVWMKGHDYVHIQPHKLEVLDKHGILKIKNTTFSDSGIYTCVHNSRPVSNITLMVRPYTGPMEDINRNRVSSSDKRPGRERGTHDSTLFADQQLIWPLAPLFRTNQDKINVVTSPSLSSSSSSAFVDPSEVGNLTSEQKGPNLDAHEEEEEEGGRMKNVEVMVTPFSTVKLSLEPEFFLSSTESSFKEAVDDDVKLSMVDTIGEVNLEEEKRRMEEEENDEENLEEMIPMKTKVSTSTIMIPLGDTFSTTFTTSDGTSSSTTGTGTATISPEPTSIFNYEFGLDLSPESPDSAQVLVPTYASLSSTTTTPPSTTSTDVVSSPPQIIRDYYDAVEATTTTMSMNMFEGALLEEEKEEGGIREGGSEKAEIIEPYLLECQNVNRESAIDGQNHHHHQPHPHRHHHGGGGGHQYNSNYNRYRSNRRRRRWRNGHNNSQSLNRGSSSSGSDHRETNGNDDIPFSNSFRPTATAGAGGKRRSVSCPSAITMNDDDDGDGHKENAEITGEGKIDQGNHNQRRYQRRGVWKVGNWTLCDTKECFTWNTATRKREVWCEFFNGSNAGESVCDSAIQPPDNEECYNPDCTGLWKTEKWSQCTARCGSIGLKTRILKCVWQGSLRPAGHACHSLPRPLVKKSCRGPPCSLFLHNVTTSAAATSSLSSSSLSGPSSLLSPSFPFFEDRRSPTSIQNSNKNSNNIINHLSNRDNKVRNSLISSNLYDPRVITSNPRSTNNANTNSNLHHRRHNNLLNEQALRSRLSMLDRNTLLEEFLRFFHLYYSSSSSSEHRHHHHHNQNGVNQEEDRRGGGEMMSSSVIINDNYDDSTTTSTFNSIHPRYPPGKSGNNNYNLVSLQTGVGGGGGSGDDGDNYSDY